MIALELAGDHPLTIPCQALEGYHRPLGGDSASLTVTVAHHDLLPVWLANPPLGIACAVRFDGALALEGVLQSVRVTSQSVGFRIEG